MAVKKASAKSKRKSTNGRSMLQAMTKKVMPVVKDPLTKSGIIKALTGMTCIAKKDVTNIIESLGTLIELHVKSRGPGKFIMPGLLKINVVKKPARAARKGVNPFTGEEMMFKAKPAHKIVKIRPLSKLKEMVD